MTFLELVQRYHEECDVAGNPPSTVVGQTGELKRLVNDIATAWRRIQEKHKVWRFLRLSASWTSIDGQATYTTAECGIAAGTFGQWIPRTFRNYLTSGGTAGEIHMSHLSYDEWRDLWLFSSNRDVKQQPVDYAIMPDDGIALGPKPPSGYTFLGEYYRSAVTLSVDADEPALPSKHDPMIIVYRAMMLYGARESAPEIYNLGKSEYDDRIIQLELDQLPKPSFGGPLA